MGLRVWISHQGGQSYLNWDYFTTEGGIIDHLEGWARALNSGKRLPGPAVPRVMYSEKLRKEYRLEGKIPKVYVEIIQRGRLEEEEAPLWKR